MDLLEYQGKQFFQKYGIPVSPGGGEVAKTVAEAEAAAEKIGYPVVVKAQVQVGGRGKLGGIQMADNADETRTHALNILGMDIKGHIVQTLWIEKATEIAEEYYVSFTLDRSKKLDLGMLSAKGGMDIEKVAEENPADIALVYLDPNKGLDEAAAREWVKTANLNPAAENGVVDVLVKLYKGYVEGDADLCEINPLVLGKDGGVYALDAKVSLDDAAGFRHEDRESFERPAILDEREKMAKELGLQYVGLDGTVGIMANGAGLAMSTLDIVNQVGGKAANFLDIGGGASADVVANALSVINSDENVGAIFINVFGGITRGEEVANGIVEGMSRVDLKSPVVVRLDGTNAEEGRAILDANASEKLIRANTMLDAAQKAVAIAGGKA